MTRERLRMLIETVRGTAHSLKAFNVPVTVRELNELAHWAETILNETANGPTTVVLEE